MRDRHERIAFRTMPASAQARQGGQTHEDQLWGPRAECHVQHREHVRVKGVALGVEVTDSRSDVRGWY